MSDLPDSIADLVDDPFRSLAGALRTAGGFAKVATPYAEFQWADYLRRRLAAKDLGADPAGALRRALVLARAAEARSLPGWSEPARPLR